jgi:sodium/bile acid cotransporter 7
MSGPHAVSHSHTNSSSSSTTKLDQLEAGSRHFSRTSTWDDSDTIVPDQSRKGSLPLTETITSTYDPDHPSPPNEKNASTDVHVEEEKSGRAWYHPISLFWTAVDNWFLIGIAVFITLAFLFPAVGKEGGYLRAEYTISYGAIALIFLITGLTLSTQALYHQFRNWYSHLFTQVFSLLFFPAVMFAIVNIIKAAKDDAIDPYILVGLMMMAILPTTVAANVTMTREAEGNEEAATAECCIGQVLGIFLSPLFLKGFMSAPGWEYGMPIAEGGKSNGEGLKEIYKQVGQKMGLAIFLPMIVGQIIQKCVKFRR